MRERGLDRSIPTSLFQVSPTQHDSELVWHLANCARFITRPVSDEGCHGWEETNYDGPEPPCFTHVLRDMMREISAFLIEYNVEHYFGWGSLLGLVREDKLIPWTADNDLMIPYTELARFYQNENRMMDVLRSRGISFLRLGSHRMCFNTAYLGGKLEGRWGDYSGFGYRKGDHYPYTDLFVTKTVTQKNGETGRYFNSCFIPDNLVYPLRERLVYNNTFSIKVPANPEGWLERIYGKRWRVPDRKQSGHGTTSCVHQVLE
eukprot:TRINITY_DN1182_c0_g1_i1.p1 TRINITY_DN1182_c0_g1~~TRINITY_DN1182_c0_g1_i1.p1  ORF type:complete len:261 (-),score=32.91 TRINITY_DN1182_c0_g1_i1:38-820(-)